jgi:hypothetical protein
MAVGTAIDGFLVGRVAALAVGRRMCAIKGDRMPSGRQNRSCETERRVAGLTIVPIVWLRRWVVATGTARAQFLSGHVTCFTSRAGVRSLQGYRMYVRRQAGGLEAILIMATLALSSIMWLRRRLVAVRALERDGFALTLRVARRTVSGIMSTQQRHRVTDGNLIHFVKPKR